MRYASLIVNWNSADILPLTLKSVVEVFGAERIFFWDNASEDDSVHIAKSCGVRVIPFARNVGFAGAVNRFLDMPESRYIKYLFIFNPDIVWYQGDLRRILSFFESEVEEFLPSCEGSEEIFSLGGMLYYPEIHDSETADDRGNFYRFSPGRFQVGSRTFEFDGTYFRVKNIPEELHFLSKFPLMPTLFNTGGAMVVNLKIFRKLGGFDEVFFPGYWEDTDLCFRAWFNGFPSFVFREWKMIHYDKYSMRKKYGDGISHISARNSYIFLWKNLKGNKFGLLWRHFFDALKEHLSGNDRFLRAFFSAVARYRFGLFRRCGYPEEFFKKLRSCLPEY